MGTYRVNMRRPIATVLALGLAAGVAAAFAVSGAPRAQAAGTVDLTLDWTSNQVESMTSVITAFEKVNPSIHITPQFLSPDAYDTLEYTQYAAGAGPDLGIATTGHGGAPDIDYFGRAGFLENLANQPWASPKSDQTLKVVDQLGLANVGKKVYGYTPALALFGVDYNETLFTKDHISIPTDYAQMLSVCKKLDADGVIPIYFAGSDLSTFADEIVDITDPIVDGANPNWETEREAGKVKFSTTPAWTQGLERVMQMSSDGCFGPSPSPAAATPTEATQEMLSDGAAMFLDPEGELPLLKAVDPSYQMGLFAFPGTTAKQTVATWYGGTSMTVKAGLPSAENAAALKFVAFFASPGEAAKFNAIQGESSPEQANAGNFAPVAYAEPEGKIYKAGRTAFMMTQDWPLATVDALAQGVQGLFTHQTTIAAVLKSMDQADVAAKSAAVGR